MRGILTLVCLFFLQLCLNAQTPPLQKYFILKKNEPVHINAMLQSRAGFIWYATNKGFFKFDGIAFQPFDMSATFSMTQVTAIAEDSLGRIWIGFKNGKIAFIDQNKITGFNPDEGNATAEISDMLFDSKGIFWFSTLGDGLYYYRQNRLYRLDEQDGMPDVFVYDIVEDHHGTIWAATDGGVAICKRNAKNMRVDVLDEKSGLPDNIVKKLQLCNTTLLMATEDKGIVAFDTTTRKTFVVADDVWIKGSIADFVVNENKIWFSVLQHGLFVYDLQTGEQKQYLGKDNALTAVNKLLFDFEGNLWTGTKTGLQRLYADHIEVLDNFALTKNSSVLALTLDKQNNIWFSNGEGLFKRMLYDHDNSEVQLLKGTEFQSKTIISLYCDAQGFIWAGLYGEGVLRIDPSTNKTIHFSDALRNGNVLNITGAGNVVWLATLGGVTSIEVNSDDFIVKNYSKKEGLISDYIYQVFIDSKNRKWFATDGKGVDRLDDRGVRHIRGSLDNKVVFGFVEDKHHVVWANVQGEGLYRFESDDFKPIPSIKLRDKNINSFGIDNAGRIVVMHDLGMDVLDAFTYQVQNVSDGENSHARLANLNAVTKAVNGRLYFGTETGVVSYAEDIGRDVQLPQPYIDGLKILNKKVAAENGLALLYHHNNITFQYHGFWFQNPQGLIFRYKLINYDHDWIVSQDRNATYSSLPPGRYTFVVSTSSTGDFSNANEASFEFSILPPFWKTKTFYAGVLLSLVALVYGYVKYRERKLVKAKQILEEKVEERTQEIQRKNEEIQSQAEEIRGINENLEMLVRERTEELEMKNKALEDSAFIIAHELRAPVASVLGLINLISKSKLDDEGRIVANHLEDSAEKLNTIVRTITKAIERGDDPSVR